ncbi:uncharacterized protein NMK_1853 [Novimethylophilus kurashikiensis]|uniref:DUF2491 family protein n=1 Tax=Novimethylophilus kurashikiensis TaxID=1825523 RepID=A0A2R5F7W7_9PROT|nr:DUF2491 family protein [Novimethylophilus kurashikiensis]GBG14287.1 uncharacterized protein NMK_1853 [Novimethylophilus kurashikiensis]
MSIFELGRRILDKKLDAHAQAAVKAEREDKGLPLGARIGSLLELPVADFALLNKSLMRVPAKQQQVVALSRLHLDEAEDIGLYRLYTDCGSDRAGDGASFLQVLTSGSEVQEATYYQFLFRSIPVTEEEQAPYLGEGFGLGEQLYSMADDQLELIGLDSSQIENLLGDAEALDFVRDTPGGDYVPPILATENRIDDQFGDKGLSQTIRFMQYMRVLPEDGLGSKEERLLISFSVVDSLDGQKAPMVHIDFMIGIPLSLSKIKVY